MRRGKKCNKQTLRYRERILDWMDIPVNMSQMQNSVHKGITALATFLDISNINARNHYYSYMEKYDIALKVVIFF
jgi:hypothetical protein